MVLTVLPTLGLAPAIRSTHADRIDFSGNHRIAAFYAEKLCSKPALVLARQPCLLLPVVGSRQTTAHRLFLQMGNRAPPPLWAENSSGAGRR